VTLLQEVDLEDRFLRPISRENEALRGAFLARAIPPPPALSAACRRSADGRAAGRGG
jgi:hypothetical protein